MIPSLPRPRWLRAATAAYVIAFLVFLFLPLAVVVVFAFNDANYPAPPWRGFTLDWFLGNAALGRTGLFADSELLRSILTSGVVAVCVTAAAAVVGTTNAFILERGRFPGKQALSILMMAPLVIPGVILGISILAFASRIADFADDTWGLEWEFLRPGLPLVVLGQFSYIATIATLTIGARLRRFDRTLEEAALNLGASKAAVFRTILLPYLRPALLGSAAISYVIRRLQHHADVGGRRCAADRHHVRTHARGREPGAECGQPVSDACLGGVGADVAAPGPHAVLGGAVQRFADAGQLRRGFIELRMEARCRPGDGDDKDARCPPECAR
jgi:spermidine/putrescine transport system permease protein